MPPAWQPKRSSAPVFIACNVRTSFSPSCGVARLLHEAAFGGEIEHLAAGHAADTGGARQRHDQFDAHARIGMGLWPRQDVEGEGEQAVAGQDGGRLVELLVRGRLAAPQFVVVHGGQIVVHQRVAVHAFQRRARHQGVLPRHVEQGRAFDDQERPEPLAAAEAGIAHGLEQPRRPARFARAGRCRQQPVEQDLDVGGDRIEAREKGAIFVVHCSHYPAAVLTIEA